MAMKQNTSSQELTDNFIAIDLGASSGRVILSRYDRNEKTFSLEEIHRFNNKLVHEQEHYYWDLDYLETEILTGLHKTLEKESCIQGIGVDSWGVDYVLLNKEGKIVAPTFSYRDIRTNGVMELVAKELKPSKLYALTGIQFLTFNTIYQLKAMMMENPSYLNEVSDLIMIPDYFNYRLTGNLNREYTNATTTALVNVHTKQWDLELLDYLKVDKKWFGQIKQPDHVIGDWKPNQNTSIPVHSVPSHDTASAIVGTPLLNENSAYLCSGTWSLMGVVSLEPFTNETALEMNITNEGGMDFHYRVLKNIMGLWLFQRICREHDITDIKTLIDEASQEEAFKYLINPNHASFLNPESMTQAIQDYCQSRHQGTPLTVAQLTRTIFDSLALLYKKVLNELMSLQNKPITTLHIVGGGSKNNFLNQLCADVCEIKVLAGPTEASTLGNVGSQLITQGIIHSQSDLRKIIAKSFPLTSYEPQTANQQQIEEKWQQFLLLD